MHVLGIEIGGTKLQVVAGNEEGKIIARRRLVIQREAGAEGIRSQLAATLPELIRSFEPEAIGVGFGGPVRWRSGEIACSHHVPGWSEFPLSAWLHDRTGLPVVVDNDANVAALGEAACGKGAGIRVVFYVTLGSGVGGGLVVDGRIFHGASPGEVEVGHLRLDPSGTILEERCSGWAMDRRVREEVAGLRGVDSELARLVRMAEPGNEARHLGPALAAGDSLAEHLVNEHAAGLGFALSHVVHLLHPDVIILGGGLSLLGEPLRSRVFTTMERHVMTAFQPVPPILLASFSEDAVPVGALVLARTAVSLQEPAMAQ